MGNPKLIPRASPYPQTMSQTHNHMALVKLCYCYCYYYEDKEYKHTVGDKTNQLHLLPTGP